MNFKTRLFMVLALPFAVMLVSGCSSRKGKDSADNMSISNYAGNTAYYSAVLETINVKPSEALTMIEKGEHTGMLTWAQACELRYRTYLKQGNNGKAIIVLGEFIADPSFGQLPELTQQEILLDKVKTNIRMSRYDVALDEALGLVKRARRLGDDVMLAEADMQVATIYAAQHLYNGSQEYADLAYNRLKDGNSNRELLAMSSVLSQSLDNCIGSKQFASAEKVIGEWASNLSKLRGKKDIDEGTLLEQEVAYFAKSALVYQMEGNTAKAADAYATYSSYDFSKVGRQDEATPYLILLGKYDEALENMPTLLSYGIDTVRMGYYNNLLDRARIAYHKGEVEHAVDYHLRADAIKDSINIRNIMAATIEAEGQMGLDHQSETINKHQKTIRSQQIILGIAALLFILVMALVPMLLYTLKSVKKRNELLAKQVDDQIAYTQKLAMVRSELDQANTKVEMYEKDAEHSGQAPLAEEAPGSEAAAANEDMVRQFVAMDKIIEDRKLYLDPDFNRTQLEIETNIPKEVASRLIKANTGYNFTVYINEKRLKHSVTLLRDYKNYTIEAVAMDSGFGEVRSFYRVFREKFGVTPTTYRESIVKKS